MGDGPSAPAHTRMSGTLRPLRVESELAALLTDGCSRTRATELVIERSVAAALDAETVVLVEGLSDLIALEVVAERRGRDLRGDGVAVVAMGGATNIGRFVSLFGPTGRGARLTGLYDAAEQRHVASALDHAGLGSRPLEALGFFACVDDLEDELIRCLGADAVERVIEGQGDLASFRRMQNEPFHRGRPHDRQLHRFVGRDRYRYGRALAEALDLTHVPRPVARLLAIL